MSDSSIALKPVIDEPSKPIPSSSAPSISDGRHGERLEVALEVGEPEQDVLDLLVAERLEHRSPRRDARRRAVLGLHHRGAARRRARPRSRHQRSPPSKRQKPRARLIRARGSVAPKDMRDVTTRRGGPSRSRARERVCHVVARSGTRRRAPVGLESGGSPRGSLPRRRPRGHHCKRGGEHAAGEAASSGYSRPTGGRNLRSGAARPPSRGPGGRPG